ncbi:MAG: ATP-grasp domain-containing protein [Oscillospiraceae bacterium]|nr:ATP-grasp domain-containing protein [Oscillospiraceae bacterium]
MVSDKRPLKVWFSRWFSSAYYICGLIKQNENFDITLIGSSPDRYSIFGKSCDIYFTEPRGMNYKQYLYYCVDFCKKNSIDIFVPKHDLAYITKNRRLFEKNGTKLLVQHTDSDISAADSKSRTYKLIGSAFPQLIPEYYLCRKPGDLRKYYDIIRRKHKRVCYKLDRDEGALSYRLIDNGMYSSRNILKPPENRITLYNAEQNLRHYSFKVPYIIMPFLDGYELSVDCFNNGRDTVMIPRYKSESRYEKIYYDDKMLAICRRIDKLLGYDMPYNIQFRFGGGRPYLLEINPRMSGGMQIGCIATGYNFPSEAINKLMGVPCTEYIPDRMTRIMSYTESPLIVSERAEGSGHYDNAEWSLITDPGSGI